MPHDVIVDLGSFSISHYLDKNFVLTLSTSMFLSLPSQYPDNLTGAEIRDQVKAGSLWITRAGSCHIEVNICLGDSLDCCKREQLQHMIIDAFEAFPAWTALGLNLKRDYNQLDELRGARSRYPYSVHHDQQNAGLMAPYQVPCAYVSVLSCNFTFGARGTATDTLPSSIMVNQPPRQNSETVNLHLSTDMVQRILMTQSNDVRDDANLHTDSQTVTLQVPSRDLRAILGLPDIYSLPLDVQAERLKYLTQSALYSILETRKKFSGILVLQRTSSPTVLEIAPAVWSSRYFQDVVCRSQMAPFISSALDALTTTESQGLHHKLQSLNVDTIQGFHRQVLVLILRSARIGKLQQPNAQPQPSFHLPSQSSFQPSSRLSSRPVSTTEFEAEIDRMHDIEEAEDGYRVSGSLQEHLQETQQAPNYEHGLSSDKIRHNAEDKVSNMVHYHDWPAYDHPSDEGPSQGHELPWSALGFSDSLLDPILVQQSIGLASDSILAVETLDDRDLRGLPSDDGAPPEHRDLSFDEMDDGYAKDDQFLSSRVPKEWDGLNDDRAEENQVYSAWEPGEWDHAHPGSWESTELGSDSISIESPADEAVLGIHDYPAASYQQCRLSPEEMFRDGAENGQSNLYGGPDELTYRYHEQDLMYESEEQSDELMSEMWEHPDYASGNADMLSGEGDEEALPSGFLNHRGSGDKLPRMPSQLSAV